MHIVYISLKSLHCVINLDGVEQCESSSMSQSVCISGYFIILMVAIPERSITGCQSSPASARECQVDIFAL